METPEKAFAGDRGVKPQPGLFLENREGKQAIK